MEPLMLQCWVRGDDVGRIFPIRISRTETVGFLKEAIKNKNPVAFHNADAKDLALYSIPFPDIEHLQHELNPWTSNYLAPQNKVSNYFPESNHTEWLIIIDVPSSVIIRPPAPVAELTLNCWIRGTSIGLIFPVEISKKKTIGFLKKIIKNEKPVDFQGVDANNLVLYKVCVPWNDDLSRNLASLVLEQTLPPLEILSGVFSDPLQKYVHVVVEAPLSGVRTAPQPAEEDMMTRLIRSFKLATTINSKSLTPSQAAKSKGYLKVQSGEQRIFDCRCAKDNPVNAVAPPIQLFNPTFAFFSSKAFDPEYHVPDDVVRDVRNLMAQFALIHEKEDDHRSSLRSSLVNVIGYPLLSLNNTDKTSLDLVATSKCGKLQTFLVVAEDKNEFGDGGSDPSVQAAFSFQRIFCQEENAEIRLRCCCPTFMIAHAGPWLAIMGGVITGRCIVQRLTDFVWIPVHSTHDDNQFLRIARVLYALRKSIERLDSWYKDTINEVVPFDESSPHISHPRFFPSPNTYRDGDSLVRFAYLAPLEHDVSCVTYRAKTLGDHPKEIVVKFVTSYGADAHRHMALADHAPKLLYYGRIDVEPGMPLYGELRMVVMEYVDGLTLDKALPLRRVPGSLGFDLQEAFKHLHKAGYVFGDLRQPNVMLKCDGKVQLIDFDWAGKDSEVKYPVAISSSIAWPPGAQGLAPIRKEHDNVMLDALLNSIYPEQDPIHNLDRGLATN